MRTFHRMFPVCLSSCSSIALLDCVQMISDKVTFTLGRKLESPTRRSYKMNLVLSNLIARFRPFRFLENPQSVFADSLSKGNKKAGEVQLSLLEKWYHACQ